MEAFWKLGHVNCNRVVRYYCLSQTLALSNLAFSLNNFFISHRKIMVCIIIDANKHLCLQFRPVIHLLDISTWMSCGHLKQRLQMESRSSQLLLPCVSLSTWSRQPEMSKSPSTPLSLLPRGCSIAQSWWCYLLKHGESVRSLQPHCYDRSLCCHLLLSVCGNGLLTVLPLRVLHPLLPLNPLSTQ